MQGQCKTSMHITTSRKPEMVNETIAEKFGDCENVDECPVGSSRGSELVRSKFTLDASGGAFAFSDRFSQMLEQASDYAMEVDYAYG